MTDRLYKLAQSGVLSATFRVYSDSTDFRTQDILRKKVVHRLRDLGFNAHIVIKEETYTLKVDLRPSTLQLIIESIKKWI